MTKTKQEHWIYDPLFLAILLVILTLVSGLIWGFQNLYILLMTFLNYSIKVWWLLLFALTVSLLRSAKKNVKPKSDYKPRKISKQKIWVKRIHNADDIYDYVGMYEDDLIMAAGEEAMNRYTEYSYENMPRSFSFYMNYKDRVFNGWLTQLIVGAIIGSVVTYIFTKG